jgi:DNA-nicking Smr family endonuclease
MIFMKLIEAKKFAAEIDDQMPELDLHLTRPEFFDARVDQFLFKCSAEKVPRAKIITGIGTGAFHDRVMEFLNSHNLAVATVDQPGSIVVILQ